MQNDADAVARLLCLLANGHRLLVLCLLIEREELSTGQLFEHAPLSASVLSQHLALLRRHGLVVIRRQAQSIHYHIDDPDVLRVMAVLKAIFCPEI